VVVLYTSVSTAANELLFKPSTNMYASAFEYTLQNHYAKL